MPRKKLIYEKDLIYHIYARSNNREWFYIDTHDLWTIFLKELTDLVERYNFRIYAFVLMNNHYHLIAACSEEYPLGTVMCELQTKVSIEANALAKRINHFWGGPYKASMITDEVYYATCLKYVLRNPVTAGICNRVEDYDYSISSILNQGTKLPLSCPEAERGIHKLLKNPLNWLNESYKEEDSIAVKNALTRTEFKPKHRKTRKPLPYNASLLP